MKFKNVKKTLYLRGAGTVLTLSLAAGTIAPAAPLLLKLRTVLYRKRKFRRPTPRGMTFPWEQKQKRQQLRKQQNIQRQQHLKQIRLFLRHWNQKKQNPAQAKQSLRKRLRIRTEPGKLFPLRMMRNFWRRLLRRRFLLIS